LKKAIWLNHTNLGHLYRRLRGAEGGESPPALGDFGKLVAKIMHFRHTGIS